MVSPGNLFRVMNEFVFMLVGGLLVLFALTGRYLFNPRQPGWIVLSIVVILWGLGTWSRARLSRVAAERLVTKIGGGSLVAGGLIERTVSDARPPGVTYKLSDAGAALLPILRELGKWAEKNLPKACNEV